MADLVTIATFPSLITAQLAQGRLEAAGIEAFVADVHTMAINPYLSVAGGGVRLRVREEDAKDALAVLEDPGVESAE